MNNPIMGIANVKTIIDLLGERKLDKIENKLEENRQLKAFEIEMLQMKKQIEMLQSDYYLLSNKYKQLKKILIVNNSKA